jgi:hypothetical protein
MELGPSQFGCPRVQHAEMHVGTLGKGPQEEQCICQYTRKMIELLS